MTVNMQKNSNTCLIPMTHAPETGDINWLHFSGADFWYMRHTNLAPDSGAD